jgi:hypothetical protein
MRVLKITHENLKMWGRFPGKYQLEDIPQSVTKGLQELPKNAVKKIASELKIRGRSKAPVEDLVTFLKDLIGTTISMKEIKTDEKAFLSCKSKMFQTYDTPYKEFITLICYLKSRGITISPTVLKESMETNKSLSWMIQSKPLKFKLKVKQSNLARFVHSEGFIFQDFKSISSHKFDFNLFKRKIAYKILDKLQWYIKGRGNLKLYQLQSDLDDIKRHIKSTKKNRWVFLDTPKRVDHFFKTLVKKKFIKKNSKRYKLMVDTLKPIYEKTILDEIEERARRKFVITTDYSTFKRGWWEYEDRMSITDHRVPIEYTEVFCNIFIALGGNQGSLKAVKSLQERIKKTYNETLELRETYKEAEKEEQRYIQELSKDKPRIEQNYKTFMKDLGERKFEDLIPDPPPLKPEKKVKINITSPGDLNQLKLPDLKYLAKIHQIKRFSSKKRDLLVSDLSPFYQKNLTKKILGEYYYHKGIIWFSEIASNIAFWEGRAVPEHLLSTNEGKVTPIPKEVIESLVFKTFKIGRNQFSTKDLKEIKRVLGPTLHVSKSKNLLFFWNGRWSGVMGQSRSNYYVLLQEIIVEYQYQRETVDIEINEKHYQVKYFTTEENHAKKWEKSESGRMLEGERISLSLESLINLKSRRITFEIMKIADRKGFFHPRSLKYSEFKV